VSTVLRPVGPHRSRVYWLRRAWVLGLIVVIIVLLIELLSGGGSSKPDAKTTPKPTVTPTPSTTTTAQLTACDPSTLTLVLSTDSDTYTSGQTPKLIGELSNPTTTACTLSRSPADEIWTVKSGTDTVWTTKGCASSTPAKQTTLKAGATKTLSIFWDGHRMNSDCSEGDVALAGEYTLHATLDGVKGKVAVFQITS
jgi:hypothetical protein